MSTKTQENIAAAIRKNYPMPRRIAFLRRIASHDLYYGPVSSDPESPYNPDPPCAGESRAEQLRQGRVTPLTWKGFSTACNALRAWADDLPSTLYYDDDCGYLGDTEPQAWEDEETGEWIEPFPYYQVEQGEIRKALFGALAEYL